MSLKRKKLQQSNQVSQEELAKTQVLNLSDVQEIANYEKKTSKRPAVMFAVAGLLSISLGFAYPNIMSTLDSVPTNITSADKIVTIDEEEIQNKVQENSLNCVLTVPSNPDGTSGVATYDFLFDENNQLKSYTMVLEMMPQINNQNGMVAVQNYYNNYKQLDDITIEGYKTTTTYTDTGMKIIINVDLEKVNQTMLTPMHTSNYFANIFYNLNDSKEVLNQQLTNSGFVCK